MFRSQIIRVEEPKIVYPYRKGLYRVWYQEDGKEYSADMTEKGYKVAKLKDMFLKLEYNMSLIEEFEDALNELEMERESFND